jgi:hypothetical protein
MKRFIGPQKTFDGEVPFWMFAHLGKQVRLTCDWAEYAEDGGEDRCWQRKGTVAILDGIQGAAGQDKRALLLIDPEDAGWVFDIPVQYVEPVVTEQLEEPSFLQGLPARLREVFLTWRHGIDPKTQYSKNTFYRYRRMLLPFGVDIGGKPR